MKKNKLFLIVGLVVLVIVLYLNKEALKEQMAGDRGAGSTIFKRVEQAKVLIGQDQPAQAIKLLELNVQEKDFEKNTLFWLTYIYVEKKDFDKAFLYARPLVEKTKDPQMLVEVGALFAINGYEKMAMACFAQALKADNKFIPAYIELGKVYGNQEKFIQAIGVWQDALRFEPNNPEIQALIKQAYALWEEQSAAE